MKLATMALAGAAAILAVGAAASIAAPTQEGRATATAAPPANNASPGTRCFRTHDIRNHTIGDDRTLYISVNLHDVYRIGMSGSCLAGAIPSDPIIMREPPGMQYVCKPIDLDISISRNGFRTPCIPSSLVQLSPAEIAALPPKMKP